LNISVIQTALDLAIHKALKDPYKNELKAYLNAKLNFEFEMFVQNLRLKLNEAKQT